MYLVAFGFNEVFALLFRATSYYCGGLSVHIVIRTLDILIIVVAITLARMLRIRFFYIASVLFVVLSVLRLHYGLNYQWTFLGKYGVNVAIPLVMAWAGNHLAAKSSKTDSEKRLWQALFITLTVLALGGSFWVLSNEDNEHKKELSGLRTDITGDVITAIIKYNETHPKNPVTSDQLVGFMRVFNGRPASQYPATPSAKEIAKELGHLTPMCTDKVRDGPDPYKDVCSKVVADVAMNIGTKAYSKAEELGQTLRDLQSSNQNYRVPHFRGMFAYDIKVCCVQSMLELHTELVKRRVPDAIEDDGESRFIGLAWRSRDANYSDWSEVSDCAQYLQRLATALLARSKS